MHFRTACCSWTSRGKPRFRFEELCLTPERRQLAVPPPSFNPEIQFTPRHEWEREIEEHNLWWKIGQLAMMHLDEHVAKSLRVLMWAGAMLGSSRPCLPFVFLPKSDSIPKPESLPLFVPRGTLSKDVAQGDEWGPRYRNSVLPECIARIDHTLYLRTALLVLEALPIIDKDRAKRFKDAYKHNWSLLPTGREAAYRLDVWKLLAGKEATPADPPIDSASCASE